MSEKYAILATDGELKKQLKARQCYHPGCDDRASLLQALANDMKAKGNTPIITHCKLSGIHCLVVTNSMKPSQMVWGFHGAYSNAWAFLNFAQVLCYRATSKRLGTCVVLPFGPLDVSDRDAVVQGKRGPHMWLPNVRDQSTESTKEFKRASSRVAPSNSRRGRFLQFLSDPSKSLRESSFADGALDTLVAQVQGGIDNACKTLRIPDCNLALIGFDQGALVAQELTLRLRSPPLFTSLWSTSPSTEFIKRARIGEWSPDMKYYRTKSTQLLICHGERDQVAPLKEILMMRELLNANGYKTLSFTHNKGHEVPDPVQKVTIDSWLERLEKMTKRGYPDPPAHLRSSCSVIPCSDDVPQKSDHLSTGVVHTSVAIQEVPPQSQPAHPGPPAKSPKALDPQLLQPSADHSKNNSNIDSRFIQSLDICLEDPEAFRYSQVADDIKGSSSHDPTIFKVQDNSMAFGINSIWDPKGFVATN